MSVSFCILHYPLAIPRHFHTVYGPSMLRVFHALSLLGFVLLPWPLAAYGQAPHVVISEFATRGPSTATDEFAELYNPTDNAIDISGWKLQYKSSAGTSWQDRAIIPAGTAMQPHRYYLLAPTAYTGSVTPDLVAAGWTTGIADNGHLRIADAFLSEVDKVGWGSAIDPEGGVTAPNHGTSGNSNSVQRKALAGSTTDSLAAGGLHALLGNGYDSNVNGNDFVVQTHGRDPQNSSAPPEPGFATGGNGTGRVTITPVSVFSNSSVPSLVFTVTEDSSYTLQHISVVIPPVWFWSKSGSDVSLAGSAFAQASVAVSGDTVVVAQAAVSPADNGTITIRSLTSPAGSAFSTFTVSTAVADGVPALLAEQPRVRVLELVPIVLVHGNDAQGIPAAPYQVGAEATVTGVVTATYSSTWTDFYVQDRTAGVNVFGFTPPPFAVVPGDSLTLTGSILQFRGLTEIAPEMSLLVRHASGRALPEPRVLTCSEVNGTFQVDGSEPNESRLIRVNGVVYNQAASTITDASGTAPIFIATSFPPVPGVFDVIGILKQYKPGTPAPGPPFTSDYEIVPRDSADIIAHPGPIITSIPMEDQIQPASVRLRWTTDVISTSIVRFGATTAWADSLIDTTRVVDHAVVLSGLSSATVYHYAVGSGDDNGTNFSPASLFCTASPAQASGAINVYFNKSVDTGVAWGQAAAGNQNLVARLALRINNARRSVDAALYSLSGTPGPGTDIAAALINAKSRGVRVRVICENDNRNTSPLNTLASSGIPVITDVFDAVNAGVGLMHNKFMVIDGRSGAPESVWVWTGSWNPTDPGTSSDYQNAVEVQDAALARAYTLEFEEMWGGGGEAPIAAASRFGARKIDNTPHRFVVGGRAVECYFSPSDRTTTRINEALRAGTHSIAIGLLTFTRADLAQTLVTQKGSGVKVRGVFDNNTDTGSQYAFLQGSGVDVRLKIGSGLLHHKYAVIDAESPSWDGVTVTGSHNWSSSAENANDENTLVIHDPVVANHYLQEFAARYYQFGGTDSITVGVGENETREPSTFALEQNYPNPFNPEAVIRFAIPRNGLVDLRVYDVLGREVATLLHEERIAGTHEVTWYAHDAASGIYFCRLSVGALVQTSKMILIK
jgi:phosphatidylserine/phosphatidylglycerophosphate/cardiolipin synthase-like enzyme